MDPILYCHCARADLVPAGTRRSVLEALCERGEPVVAVPDLCGAAAMRNPLLEGRFATVVACYPRAVRWLLMRAGSPAPDVPEVINLREDGSSLRLRDRLRRGGEDGRDRDGAYAAVVRTGSLGADRIAGLLARVLEAGLEAELRPADGGAELRVLGESSSDGPPILDAAALGEDGVLERALAASSAGSGAGGPAEPGTGPGGAAGAAGAPPAGWIPWYPVLDIERCTSCGQCLNFCLFGVYDRDPEGRVVVRSPWSCKTNCPACARICPETAILFPRYKAGVLSGGDPATGGPETARVDLGALAGGDPYAALRARSRRFSVELPVAAGPASAGSIAAAERERCACSRDLSKALDIPPDVLASVSPSDLFRKRSGAPPSGHGPTREASLPPGRPDAGPGMEVERGAGDDAGQKTADDGGGPGAGDAAGHARG